MAGMGVWVDAIAGSLAPTGECRYLQEIGRLSGRLRGQASLLQWNGCTCKEIGRLSGRLRGQASLLQWNGGTCKRDWSAVRPPSRAGSLLQWSVGTCKEIGRLSGRLRGQASLLQWNGCTCKRLVGCQAAFASRLAPTVECVYLQKRLVGCQAAFAGKPRSYKGLGVNASLFTTHQAER
jgi:hypothetical protein